jgi:hypothetical protein
MENLVDRKAYDSDDSGYWQRLPWVMGIAFGVSMAVVLAIFLGVVFAIAQPGGDMTTGVLIGLSTGGVGGVLFGRSFPRTFRQRVSSMTDALYAGNKDLVDEPPVEKSLRYRLPCSWMKSPAFAVGGILYIGKDGMLFYPHRKNLKGDRAQFEIGPLSGIQLSLVPPPPMGLVRRTLVPNPESLLEVKVGSRSERFLIPQSARVIEIIRKRIDEQTVERHV